MELIPVALIWIIVLIIRASMKKDAQKSGVEKQTNHPNPSRAAGSPSQMTAKQQELARQKAIKKQKEEEWRKSVQRRMEDERREKEQRQKEGILERARDNAKDVQDAVSVDVISTPAVHYHPEDVLQESMLGSVEDLMVKGYDGKLCFERDFVAEGMDLLNQYTLPSEAI